jgi:hypothetical protein
MYRLPDNKIMKRVKKLESGKCTCSVLDGVLVTGSACQVHGLPDGELS